MSAASAPKLRIPFAGLDCASPIWVASGTFGYGKEFAPYLSLADLGGIATKGISPKPRGGNPLPRICETASGMINSIGLENVGVEGFREQKLPFLRQSGTQVVVNFFGETFDEYIECGAALDQLDGVHMLEMNVSCPNVKKGGVEYGTEPAVLRDLVQQCRAVIKKPLIIKLTPNTTDVVAIAKASMDGGADGLSVINTLSAMAVDARKRRPRIATTFGGLSGPAIKPIALRMVYQVHRAMPNVPISGIGGIATGEDVAEFLLAGATTVQVGTQSFAEPHAATRIRDELVQFMREEKIADVRELIGGLQGGR
ncbi:MAG TPA: dihydroorotate dehydrogenase [Polyangia bacterium]|nr:dihydroorotate dehydrogenase [Polyangia bacterium]